MELLLRQSTNPIIVESTQPPVSSHSHSANNNQKCRTLADWFLENKCIGSATMQKHFHEHTFRDNGVLRYKDSWLPAPEEGCPYLLPGSYEVSLSGQATTSSTVTAAEVGSDGTAVQKEAASVKLLFDWQLLWNYFLVNDNFDELAVHDALLRASIDFFMHKKTIYIYWILLVYTQIVLQFAFTGLGLLSLTLEGVFIELFFYFINGIYYTFLQRLYMGNGSGIKQSESPSDDEATSLNYGDRMLHRRPKYIHWYGALRHFFHLTFSEGRTTLCCCGPPNVVNNGQNSVSVIDSEPATISFNQLMNIALKFLHIHCEINPQELDRSRRIYKSAFLCLFAILSIFIVIFIFEYWYGVFYECRVFSQQGFITSTLVPQNCYLAIIHAVLCGGFIFNAALYFLFIGLASIGVIGLSYGSTLAYFMTSSWMKRYAGLRRIEGQAAVLMPTAGDTDLNNSVISYCLTWYSNCTYTNTFTLSHTPLHIHTYSPMNFKMYTYIYIIDEQQDSRSNGARSQLFFIFIIFIITGRSWKDICAVTARCDGAVSLHCGVHAPMRRSVGSCYCGDVLSRLRQPDYYCSWCTVYFDYYWSGRPRIRLSYGGLFHPNISA